MTLLSSFGRKFPNGYELVILKKWAHILLKVPSVLQIHGQLITISLRWTVCFVVRYKKKFIEKCCALWLGPPSYTPYLSKRNNNTGISRVPTEINPLVTRHSHLRSMYTWIVPSGTRIARVTLPIRAWNAPERGGNASKRAWNAPVTLRALAPTTVWGDNDLLRVNCFERWELIWLAQKLRFLKNYHCWVWTVGSLGARFGANRSLILAK